MSRLFIVVMFLCLLDCKGFQSPLDQFGVPHVKFGRVHEEMFPLDWPGLPMQYICMAHIVPVSISTPPSQDCPLPIEICAKPKALRAGWAILAWLLIFSTIAAFITAIAQRLSHGYHPAKNQPLPVAFMLVGEMLSATAMLAATWIMARLAKRPFGIYGFSLHGQLRNLTLGSVFSMVLLSGLVGILHAGGWLLFDGVHLTGAIAVRSGFLWAVAFVFLAIFEEGMMRGYLQHVLGGGIGFWWSALILSFAFGILHKHNAGESPIGLLSAGLIGLVFCFSLRRTGSLAWAVGFHAIWDWGEAFLFGVPNSGTISAGRFIGSHAIGHPLLSGGAVGPEGSIFVLPVIGIAALSVLLLTGPQAARSNATQS